jgi:hypothetical protein
MGLSDTEAASEKRSWKEIAHALEARAERAEHLLTHYLAYFGHDTQRAGDFVRDFAQKPAVRVRLWGFSKRGSGLAKRE